MSQERIFSEKLSYIDPFASAPYKKNSKIVSDLRFRYFDIILHIDGVVLLSVFAERNSLVYPSGLSVWVYNRKRCCSLVPQSFGLI